MANGNKKDEVVDFKAPNVVTLDQEEFNKVCKRVHSMLMARVDKAREKKEKKPSKRSAANHIEASKEVFVFVHLLELVENMTEEISDLRNLVSSVTGGDDEDDENNAVSGWPEMFAANRKKFLN